MKLKVYETLKKLMQRTTSENDPEALGAIRAANRILATEGLTWEKVFARVVTVVNEVEFDQPPAAKPAAEAEPRRHQNLTLKQLVEDAQAAKPDSTFVASVAEQFERRGTLSDAQVAALRNIVDGDSRW